MKFFTDSKEFSQAAFINLLEKNLVNFALLKKLQIPIGQKRISDLIHPNIVKALENNLISLNQYDPEKYSDLQQASKLYGQLKIIASDPAQKMMAKGFTIEQLCKLSEHFVNMVISPIGVCLVEEDLIPANKINDVKDLKNLFSKNGVIALRDKLLTWELAVSISNLAGFLSDRGIEALRLKLIDPSIESHVDASPILLEKNVLVVLKNK